MKKVIVTELVPGDLIVRTNGNVDMVISRSEPVRSQRPEWVAEQEIEIFLLPFGRCAPLYRERWLWKTSLRCDVL